MKVSELKSLIKPLIKECLKEVLIEEGFTKMLSESKQVSQPIVSDVPRASESTSKPKIVPPQLQEAKKKMLDAIAKGGFDAFAGTVPLASADSHEEVAQTKTSDPGVDISSLLGENKQIWKQTLDFMNGKKK